MKKYLLSFFLIVAFAFYVMLNNQSSVDVAPFSNKPVAMNSAGTSGNIPENTPAEPTPTPSPTPTPTPTPTPSPTPAPAPAPATGIYNNGSYTGPITDAYYGNVQVKAVIQGWKLSDVQILQYPNERGTSREINGAAMPQLVQEAIQAQSANVDIVSGATQSSEAFRQSLASALAQAKV